MSKLTRIAYRVGAWASIATAVIHLAGQLAGPQPPQNDTERRLVELMTTYALGLPGAPGRTMRELFDGFGFLFSVYLALTGIVALLVLQHRAAAPGLVRSAAIAFAGAHGILLGISLRYFFVAPTVCIGVAFLGFAVSLAPSDERP